MNRRRVAVIHADPGVAEMFAELLATAGYEPCLPGSGNLRDLLRRQQPALVLLDLHLYGPEPDRSLLTQIRAWSSDPKLRLIALTTSPRLARKHATGRVPASAVVVLPCDLDELLSCVFAVLGPPDANASPEAT